MIKLFNADILDIFPTDDGFVYAAKETVAGGNEAVTFHCYNNKSDFFTKMPVNLYITAKFGENGFNAARNLGDFVTCNIHTVSGKTFAFYPSGKVKHLDEIGNVTGEEIFLYKNKPVYPAIAEGKNFWCCVQDENAIINYSMKYKRAEFRIGSTEDKSFLHPTDIKYYDNLLYICSSNSYKIRTMNIYDYTVEDYFIFHEPVYKYFRSGKKEYVYLKSGVYEL